MKSTAWAVRVHYVLPGSSRGQRQQTVGIGGLPGLFAIKYGQFNRGII